ncbi:MAG TPA: ROK family protein [Methylomirabilota bacterium]|nr:ROK family protein [Methylomirabilota bacterium]
MGVDVGGTRIRGGALTTDGKVVSRIERSTEAERGPDVVLGSLLEVILQLLASHPSTETVGVACAGQIHPATGTVVYAPNLGWRDVPLAAHLQQGLGRRLTVENDVRAAAWGEFVFGAGVGAQSLVAVYVGTGVGSGAVLDGTLWRGARNGAGEVGHTQVVWDGLPCPCGRRGCLEQYASGSGFQRRLRLALADGVATRLARESSDDPARLTATMVKAAADAGDAFAREVWQDAERFLTLAVANYVTLLNPEVLVLGGGVIETVPRLFDAVAADVPRLTTVLARDLRIERARLGDWSGVVGAAALAANAAGGP